MSDKYIKKGSLSVSTDLEAFLKSEVLPGLDLTEDHFWTSLENLINEFSPRNKELLEIRESMQEQIDAWHLANPGQEKNIDFYKDFLKPQTSVLSHSVIHGTKQRKLLFAL